MVDLFAFLIGNGYLAPVDLQCVFALHQWNGVGVAIDMIFPLVLVFDPHIRRMYIFTRFELFDPLGQVGMRVRFAGENVVVAVEHDAAAEGLMSIEVVAQYRGVAVIIEMGVSP